MGSLYTTPLGGLLADIIGSPSWKLKGSNSIDQSPVILWLTALEASGVDLYEYGRRERMLLGDRETSRDFPFPWDGHSLMKEERTVRLFSFAYGPSPNDWHFYFSEPTDFLAGEFWSLIEGPEDQPMPGMWVD